MKRLSRERLFATLQLEGPASVDSVLEELRSMPRARPAREDNVLRSGHGPHFLLTRWKYQDADTLVVRLRVSVSGTESGSRAEVAVSPARVKASLLLLPLLPLLALPLSALLPGQHLRSYLCAMAAALAALFWTIAWSNVPEYEQDRREMLALVQSILDGEPLESSRSNALSVRARLGLDGRLSSAVVVLLLLVGAQPVAVLIAMLHPSLIPAPRLMLPAIFIPLDALILWWLVRTNRAGSENASADA